MLKKQKRYLDSQFIIEMYTNDSRHETYQMPSELDIANLEHETLRKLEEITSVVMNEGSYFEKVKKS